MAIAPKSSPSRLSRMNGGKSTVRLVPHTARSLRQPVFAHLYICSAVCREKFHQRQTGFCLVSSFTSWRSKIPGESSPPSRIRLHLGITLAGVDSCTSGCPPVKSEMISKISYVISTTHNYRRQRSKHAVLCRRKLSLRIRKRTRICPHRDLSAKGFSMS